MASGSSKAVLLHNDKKNEILVKIWEEMNTHLLIFALLAGPIRLLFRTKIKNVGIEDFNEKTSSLLLIENVERLNGERLNF